MNSGPPYLRNFFANVVKRIIGRSTYYSPNDLFFRTYIQCLLGLRSKPKITSPGWVNEEGLGSQARLTMCAINFARICGLPYVHTPFREISRADRPMKAWVDAWEAEFNLGHGEIPADSDDPQVIDFATMFSRYRYLDSAFEITSNEFRRKYYTNKTPRVNAILTAAVHVRRGDVFEGHRMWTELDSIVTTVEQLNGILDNLKLNYRLQIFSEAECSEFDRLESLGAELFLNTDALWTMRELIEADILVMAKSLFSYVAA